MIVKMVFEPQESGSEVSERMVECDAFYKIPTKDTLILTFERNGETVEETEFRGCMHVFVMENGKTVDSFSFGK